LPFAGPSEEPGQAAGGHVPTEPNERDHPGSTAPERRRPPGCDQGVHGRDRSPEPRRWTASDVAISHLAHGPLSALDGAPVWLHSEPLTAGGLRGRVVLVDFWTYSCVNWLRTLPYVRAWHERYRERGLVVVGAHAPEFGFEHDLVNVRRAAGELGVGYPVVID